MLQVILDADTRLQLDRLVSWLGQASQDPFVADTLIVPDLGSGIWLQQSIARETGISANVRLELPGAFIWRNVQQIVGMPDGGGDNRAERSQAPFEPMVARWAILMVLSQAADEPASDESLQPILRAWRDASERDRMVIATELARQFERYLAYRRHWLEAWAARRSPARAMAATRAAGSASAALACADQHEPWQAWLWRKLLGQISGFSEQHPFDAFEAKHPTDAVDSRAGRVAVFGQISLPAEQTRMLALLARSRPIIWFGHDPSQGFWEHVVSERRARAANPAEDAEPEQAWLYDNEPVILGEWGRQCRDSLMQMRALEEQGLAVINDSHLRERDPGIANTNLDRLRLAVLTLSDDPWREAGYSPDNSIQIHATHSLMRQADVASDLILEAFATTPDLSPADIVVFCVNVDETAPLLKAALSQSAPDVPVFVAGGRSGATPLLRALQGFIRLVEGPASVNAVFDWLEGPAQQVGSSIDADALQSLRSMMNSSGVYRDDMIQSAVDGISHGWTEGIDRLVLGALLGERGEAFAMSVAESAVQSVMPFGQLSVSQVDVLSEVARLLDLVRNWRADQVRGRTPADWSAKVQRFVDQLLTGPAVSDDALSIRDAVSQLTDSVWRVPGGQHLIVSFEAYAQALEDHLQQSVSPARVTGAITVAPVGALREVPFRVCLMLGLDEGQYPPRRRISEYDLMSLLPVAGDIHPGDAGRGWFLQALLNTRDQVCLCYQGRHIRSDAVLNPSRLIAELMSYLHRFDHSGSEPSVIEHPLQSFSPRRFSPEACAPSYARHWYEAAVALANPQDLSMQPTSPVVSAFSAETRLRVGAGNSSSTLLWRAQDVAQHLLDPARAYLRETGGISLLPFETSQLDIEPLGMHDFPAQSLFDLAVQSASRLASGWTASQVQSRLALAPSLPAGRAIEPIMRTVMTTAERLWQQEQKQLVLAGLQEGRPLDQEGRSIHVAVPLGSLAVEQGEPGQSVTSSLVSGLSGALYCESQGDVIQRLPAVRKLTMRSLMSAWLAHLLVCLDQPGDRRVRTFYLVAGDHAIGALRPVVFDRQSLQLYSELSLDAYSPLARLIMTAELAAHHVLPFFPRTATAWLEHAEPGEPIDRPQDNEKAFEQARKIYEGDAMGRTMPECQYAWPAALWRENPPSTLTVLQQSLALYAPIWWSAKRTLTAAEHDTNG
ncbi:MAG: exodeoxyribonuclease V subunit gamma [Burkholderiaceae bacterium]